MYTAIIVDDEPITRMDFAGIMEEAGYRVVAQCADGFDAVESCRLHRPDLVLMDIRMPVFDGLSAAETIIRENLAGCVFLLTAFADPEFIERAKLIGVSGYLVKPVEERVLVPAVEIAVAQSRRYAKALEETQATKAKLEEKNLLDRAKAIVSKREEISESEAYARIQKMGMDKRMSMSAIARMIVQSSGNRDLVNEAKGILMERYSIGESAAFKRLRRMAEEKNCAVEEVARLIAEGDPC